MIKKQASRFFVWFVLGFGGLWDGGPGGLQRPIERPGRHPGGPRAPRARTKTFKTKRPSRPTTPFRTAPACRQPAGARRPVEGPKLATMLALSHNTSSTSPPSTLGGCRPPRPPANGRLGGRQLLSREVWGTGAPRKLRGVWGAADPQGRWAAWGVNAPEQSPSYSVPVPKLVESLTWLHFGRRF